MVSLTLFDGTVITDLTDISEESGEHVYMSATQLDPDIFTDNLTEVIETGEDGTETVITDTVMHRLVRLNSETADTEYCFFLVPKSKAELKADELAAQIEYLAMMADIDMEV